LSVTTLINDNDIEHERGILNRAIDLSNLRRRKIAYHYRRAKLFKYIYSYYLPPAKYWLSAPRSVRSNYQS